MAGSPATSALLVVDLQEDFCPPNGSLAVEAGRDIAPVVNRLLDMPFAVKAATKDFHPRNHAAFISECNAPGTKAFVDTVLLTNPADASSQKPTTIWPVHCVQGSKGAEIISEIDASRFDFVVHKGMNPRVEMFSGFADIFGNPGPVHGSADLDLAATLREKGITDVFLVGLTGDRCVRYTALDAASRGFETYVVRDGTRSLSQGFENDGWAAATRDFLDAGVKVVASTGPEVAKISGGNS